MVELSDRQQRILKRVVEEYVITATPVSSEKIAASGGLMVSSATVRNELMELEELGLLTHPHTSAGRVPSDLGYRYYIDRLMAETALLPIEQQMIRHQFHQIEAEVGEWGPLAAAVMAQMARSAALATRICSWENRFARLELVSIQGALVLVVLILRSGELKQRLWRLDRPLEREELTRLANKLSAELVDMTGPEVAAEALRLTDLEQELALLTARLMEQGEHGWGGNIYYEGIGFVSGEPEFGRTAQLIDLMEVLRWGAPLEPLLSDVLESGSLKVVIGSENQAQQLRGLSVILKRYGRSAKAAGVVGVVGPTRMRYWRAVSLVRFMADLLDRLVDQSLT